MKLPKINYIKANGVYYRPQAAGVQEPKKIEGCCFPVCHIKKLFFGRWQIDYYNDMDIDWNKGASFYANQKPTTRLILYPSGIEEIKYINTDHEST